MNTLAQINNLTLTDPKGLINLAEQDYKNEINRIAEKILQKGSVKIVMLAGPSASGKTTSAHLLCDALAQKNMDCSVVSLDHFYLPIEQMPTLSNGAPDFETVYALDIPEIKRCFAQIIETGHTAIPIFDFEKHCRAAEKLEISATDNGIVIIEGLHALNSLLTEEFENDKLFKIYISVNASVFDDQNNELLSSRRIRLSRRLSRDAIYRNTSAEETLRLWTAVVAGEEKYLYCFRHTADVELSTFHLFEPAVFAGIVPQLLKNINENTENYEYALSVREALKQFEVLYYDLLPQDSLIREFVKGGKFENVK